MCAHHTTVYLVHRSCLCHIYSWFLPMSWILDLSILLSICRAYIYMLYMFGWLCRATCCSVVSTSMVYHMLSKTRRSSGSLNRVIGKVLVLGLLVVVYKIPYSSCMFNTAFVLVRQGVPIILLSIWYNVYACHSQVPGISLHHCYCCLPGTTYHSSLCGGYVITELVSL